LWTIIHMPRVEDNSSICSNGRRNSSRDRGGVRRCRETSGDFRLGIDGVERLEIIGRKRHQTKARRFEWLHVALRAAQRACRKTRWRLATAALHRGRGVGLIFLRRSRALGNDQTITEIELRTMEEMTIPTVPRTGTKITLQGRQTNFQICDL